MKIFQGSSRVLLLAFSISATHSYPIKAMNPQHTSCYISPEEKSDIKDALFDLMENTKKPQAFLTIIKKFYEKHGSTSSVSLLQDYLQTPGTSLRDVKSSRTNQSLLQSECLLCNDDNVSIVTIILDAPSNKDEVRALISHVDNDGDTVLYWAIYFGRIQIVNLLIKKANDLGITWNSIAHQNNQRWTPLHWAAYHNDTTITNALLTAAGTQVKNLLAIKNTDGETALDVARIRESINVLSMLEMAEKK